MLKSASVGFGSLALAGLCAEAAGQSPLAPKAPHFVPKAQRVIFVCMRGGPSHVDTFDPKPLLYRENGKIMPHSIIKNHEFAMIKSKMQLIATRSST